LIAFVESLRVASLSEISYDDAKIIRINKKAIAVVKTQDGTVKAFSAVCTAPGVHRAV